MDFYGVFVLIPAVGGEVLPFSGWDHGSWASHLEAWPAALVVNARVETLTVLHLNTEWLYYFSQGVSVLVSWLGTEPRVSRGSAVPPVSRGFPRTARPEILTCRPRSHWPHLWGPHWPLLCTGHTLFYEFDSRKGREPLRHIRLKAGRWV